MHLSKLAHLLQSEKEKIKEKEFQKAQEKKWRVNRTQEYRNLSRSSSLLQKVLIKKECHNDQQFCLDKINIIQVQEKNTQGLRKDLNPRRSTKYRTSFLISPLLQHITSNQEPNLPTFSNVPSNTNQKKQTINPDDLAPHLMCGIMQDKYWPDEVKTIVRQFLNGHQKETSLDNVKQLHFSAQALYDSAKDMSRKLAKGGDEDYDQIELETLQQKDINSIRNQSRVFTPQQTVILKRNYGLKFESNESEKNIQFQGMIDQVVPHEGNEVNKRDYDIFIPKSQINHFLDSCVINTELDMKNKQASLMKEEIKQVDEFVKQMKTFKEGMEDIVYTMNHLKRMKMSRKISSESPMNQGGKVIRFLLKRKTQKQSTKKLFSPEEEIKRKQKQKQFEDEEYKENLRKRVRKALTNFINKIKKLNLTIEDIIELKAFPQTPFEREGSYEFFKRVKEQDIEEVERLLKRNKFYVYDFDTNLKTALHYASMLNNDEMIKLLMENGADIDARDMIGRTPLHMAAKYNKESATRILLVYGANPSIKSIAGKRANELTTLNLIKSLIQNARKLHFMMELVPRKEKKNFWQQRGLI